MQRRYGPFLRVLGIALLLLAVSPVTAPFATCDLMELFGGTTAPGGSTLKSNVSPDALASEPGGASVSGGVPASTAGSRTNDPRRAPTQPALDLPLRL
jgi:hypothetical protein